MTDHDPADAVIPTMIALVVLAWVLLLLLAGCVTRTTVCVETVHGLGPSQEYVGRRDSVGGSVCTELSRPE